MKFLWIIPLFFLVSSSHQLEFLETLQGESLKVLDTDILLYVIGNQESQGQPNRTWAVSPGGTAWGKYQVKYWSAVAYGKFDEQLRLTGIPSRSPGELFISEINETVAIRILNKCKNRYGKLHIKRIAYCYYSGPNSKLYSKRLGLAYAKTIAVDYAIESLRRQKESLLFFSSEKLRD